MKQWYYSEGGQQLGPVSELELQNMLESARLPQDTLVWTDGQAQWDEARKIPEFAPSPYATPAAETLTDIDWDGYTPTGPQSRPWVRYWARTMDFLLFSLIVGIVLGVVAPEIIEMPGMMFELGLFFSYNFVEPVMFALWGNTPMKALMRIRVRNHQGARLTYLEALRRTFNVWIRGEGLGIPLVSLFTMINSYSQLSNHGITSWDASGRFQVTHQKIEWWRWVVLFGGFAAFIAVIVYSSENIS